MRTFPVTSWHLWLVLAAAIFLTFVVPPAALAYVRKKAASQDSNVVEVASSSADTAGFLLAYLLPILALLVDPTALKEPAGWVALAIVLLLVGQLYSLESLVHVQPVFHVMKYKALSCRLANGLVVVVLARGEMLPGNASLVKVGDLVRIRF